MAQKILKQLDFPDQLALQTALFLSLLASFLSVLFCESHGGVVDSGSFEFGKLPFDGDFVNVANPRM